MAEFIKNVKEEIEKLQDEIQDANPKYVGNSERNETRRAMIKALTKSLENTHLAAIKELETKLLIEQKKNC